MSGLYSLLGQVPKKQSLRHGSVGGCWWGQQRGKQEGVGEGAEPGCGLAQCLASAHPTGSQPRLRQRAVSCRNGAGKTPGRGGSCSVPGWLCPQPSLHPHCGARASSGRAAVLGQPSPSACVTGSTRLPSGGLLGEKGRSDLPVSGDLGS